MQVPAGIPLVRCSASRDRRDCGIVVWQASSSFMSGFEVPLWWLNKQGTQAGPRGILMFSPSPNPNCDPNCNGHLHQGKCDPISSNTARLPFVVRRRGNAVPANVVETSVLWRRGSAVPAGGKEVLI